MMKSSVVIPKDPELLMNLGAVGGGKGDGLPTARSHRLFPFGFPPPYRSWSKSSEIA